MSKEVRALIESGYAVDVLCLRNEGEKKNETIGKVRVYRLSHQHRRGSLLRYCFEYALSFIKMTVMATLLYCRNRYGCIQVNTLPDPLVFVTVIPRLLGAKVLLDMHEPTPELFTTKYGTEKHKILYKLIVFLEQISLKYANASLAVNDTIRQRYIERGANGQKMYVVRNVPDEAFGPCESLHNTNSGLTLMTHGMIEERYGQDVIIRALPIVRKSVEKVKLIIAGYGQEEELFKLVEKFDCSEMVTFAGRVPFSKIRELIAGTTIGIVPLKRSPFSELCQPNKLFEFIACKRPVITSRLTAIEESFDDSCVVYFEPGDHEELAQCIIELYHSPEKQRRLVENAYQRFEPLSWAQTQKVYLSVIDNLTGRKTSSTDNGVRKKDVTAYENKNQSKLVKCNK
ncbi:MAG: glycosyltransferase family 4 protein [Planctomycetota bacterium]